MHFRKRVNINTLGFMLHLDINFCSFANTEIRVQVEIISGKEDIGFCPSMPSSEAPLSDTQFRITSKSNGIPVEGKAPITTSVDTEDFLGAAKSTEQGCKAHSPVDSDDEDILRNSHSNNLLNTAHDTPLNMFGTSVGALTLNSSSVICDCYRWMWDLGYTGCDPLNFPTSCLPGAANRLDFPYELTWMAGHIKGLREIQKTVNSLISEYESMARRGLTVRKSPLKENLEMQCLPLNLHFQFMVSRRHNTKSELSEISDFTTCGAMSAHGLGYKNGGLGYQEDMLGREKAAIEGLLSQYNGQVMSRKNLHPSLPMYALFQKIGARVQAFESETLHVGLRRLFCLSQILSIAINTLLLKLNLVALGYIDAFFADRWLDQGFPLIFESLLSVSGKEKVMLEDTSRAIDILRLYRVRIIGDDNNNGSGMSKPPIITVVDREVVIKFPFEFLGCLPSRFSRTEEKNGVVITLVSFLFTVGIDIKQAMATTWENSDGNLDFQVGINKRGFTLLNEYCHKVMPVDQFAELLHPFVSDFETTLRNPSKMNVDILHEVEKISVMLGGCRVTFCKSGKDRTGMAVTLDQSRQLSEIFGLESSSDRVIRDANLMRVYGTRLMVAEKNIGRAVFAINRLQLQFMPAAYRPPISVLEDVFKASDSS